MGPVLVIFVDLQRPLILLEVQARTEIGIKCITVSMPTKITVNQNQSVKNYSIIFIIISIKLLKHLFKTFS